MDIKRLALSLRRRIFYAVLGGFLTTYLLQGTLDFVLSCPLGGLVSAALFSAWSPLQGRGRLEGAGLSLAIVLLFPLLLLLFHVGHLGLYESANPLIPFPVRLIVLMVTPALAVFFSGGWLARRHFAAAG